MAKVHNSTRRKLAISSWRSPKEGNIYGKITVDATEALAYLEAKREETGEKVTVTHLVGKAISEALRKEPTLNGYLKLGRYHRHDDVALAFLVALDDGKDLAKAKVSSMDTKSIAEIAADVRGQAERLRAGEDSEFEKSKGAIKALPTWILRHLVAFTGWLASSLGLNIKALGVTAFPFGSGIITSVGMFGLDEGYVPPTPFARVPLYVLIGAVRERVAVEDGELVIRNELTVTATIDHRFIDGFQGGILAREFRRVFENPWSLDEADTEATTTVRAA